MVYYNATNLTGAMDLLAMTQEVNRLSGSVLGFLIILSLLVIFFVAFKNFGVRTIMPIISFMLTLIAIMMAVMQLIPDWITYILIVGTGALVVASIFINPEGS